MASSVRFAQHTRAPVGRLRESWGWKGELKTFFCYTHGTLGQRALPKRVVLLGPRCDSACPATAVILPS